MPGMENVTKLLAPILLLALSSAAEPPPSPFEGILEMNIVAFWGSESTGKVRVAVSRWGIRTEWEIRNAAVEKETGGEPIRLVLIRRTDDPGQIYFVNAKTRAFAVADDRELAEFVGKRRRTATTPSQAFLVERQGKKSVAGFPCERVRITNVRIGLDMDACFLQGSLPDESLRSMPGDFRSEDWVKAARDAGVEGYPIQFDVRQNGKTQLAVEPVRFVIEAVPKSLFRIPDGYKQASLTAAVAQTPKDIKVVEEGQREMEQALREMTPEDRRRMEEILKLRPPKGD